MYIMKTSKEFATLKLTVEEVVTGLNGYFDGYLMDDVRFHSADKDYTYYYSPKCCLAAAILWLREQGVDYFCGMPVPCEEEKEKAKVIPFKVTNVLSADIKIEPDALPELIVRLALWDGTFDNVLIDSICDDLIQYISKYGEDDLEDRVEKLTEKLADQYNIFRNFRMGLINTLGADPNMTDHQLFCEVSRLYLFKREVQRRLGCQIGYSDADTMLALRRVIDKAKVFDDMDKQYMETTKGLCEIAAIIERLQSIDEKKDA